MSEDEDPYESYGHSLGVITDGFLHNIMSKRDGVDPIRGHPGRARDILDAGRWRLQSDAYWDAVEADYSRCEKICESPIERDIFAALLTGNWSGIGADRLMVHNARDNDEKFPQGTAVIIPQLAFARVRLDFAVVAKREDWCRIVGIECDGAEFHDPYKDRIRDGYCAGFGIPIIRLSGKRIYKEPLRIADEIIGNITEWVGS